MRDLRSLQEPAFFPVCMPCTMLFSKAGRCHLGGLGGGGLGGDGGGKVTGLGGGGDMTGLGGGA